MNEANDHNGYMIAEDENREEWNELTRIIDEESLHSTKDHVKVMSIIDYNEDDPKDGDCLDYDNGKDNCGDAFQQHPTRLLSARRSMFPISWKRPQQTMDFRSAITKSRPLEGNIVAWVTRPPENQFMVMCITNIEP